MHPRLAWLWFVAGIVFGCSLAQALANLGPLLYQYFNPLSPNDEIWLPSALFIVISVLSVVVAIFCGGLVCGAMHRRLVCPVHHSVQAWAWWTAVAWLFPGLLFTALGSLLVASPLPVLVIGGLILGTICGFGAGKIQADSLDESTTRPTTWLVEQLQDRWQKPTRWAIYTGLLWGVMGVVGLLAYRLLVLRSGF